MTNIDDIFIHIDKLIQTDASHDLIQQLYNTKKEVTSETCKNETKIFEFHKEFLRNIFKEIDDLSNIIKNCEEILISVKNQKLLRGCFQFITSLGISPCLIPGLGIHLSKRCSSSNILPSTYLTDEQKYEMLVNCTDFFTRSYLVPVLKNIIVTFHLCDYLAALIQLSFAPLKKPGTYNNFIMTQEMFERFSVERQKYLEIYEELVSNCFQPIIMKELLVLQSVIDPPLPSFAKKVIIKELSHRLLAPEGLLSLIRCFIESYNIDTAFEWKKIDIICKIIVTKHGSKSEDDYINNICTQLTQILKLNNTHYLTTAVACVLSLKEKYPLSEHVKSLMEEILAAFDYQQLILKSNLPGTIIMPPQEVEHKVNILYVCVCSTKLDYSVNLLLPNLYLLFLLGMKCTKSEELRIKVKDVLLKCLEQLNKNETSVVIKSLLFGNESTQQLKIIIEEYEAGPCVKCVSPPIGYPKNDALLYFLILFKSSSNNNFAQNVFEISLQILIDLTSKRQKMCNKEILLTIEDEPMLLNNNDENYANILQLLSEISTLPTVIICLKDNPSSVLDFIEYFIVENYGHYDECVTIALVLLNTILSNSNKTKDFIARLQNLIPILKKMSDDDSSLNHILCKEALTLISSDKPVIGESACAQAIFNTFDGLLPVRTHGIIELTKLIDAKDAETISKKHFIFCLFQEQLKDSDSYVYLAAVNGIASLGTLCTEDVLHVLCKEFLQISAQHKDIETMDARNKITELRMKIGDVIVKVTRRLGEMAIIHKTVLLNTMLCGCRDEDPLIRTSALSNLAEIALVLHYRIGSIIYEVLLCIWNIIETDKAIECRRAAIMIISSLLKGLGKETLVELKENLLPIYRTLKSLYRDPNEDTVVRLHSQIALDELNDIVNQFMFPELKLKKQLYVLDQPQNTFK